MSHFAAMTCVPVTSSGLIHASMVMSPVMSSVASSGISTQSSAPYGAPGQLVQECVEFLVAAELSLADLALDAPHVAFDAQRPERRLIAVHQFERRRGRRRALVIPLPGLRLAPVLLLAKPFLSLLLLSLSAISLRHDASCVGS